MTFMISLLRWIRSNLLGIGISAVMVATALFLIWPVLFGGPLTGNHHGAITVNVPTAQPVHLAVVAGTSTLMDDRVTGLAPGESVFAILKDQAAKDGVAFSSKSYPGMGDLVIGIGGFTNGTGGDYWQYKVNGQYVQTGADGYIPKPGDDILWEFSRSRE